MWHRWEAWWAQYCDKGVNESYTLLRLDSRPNLDPAFLCLVPMLYYWGALAVTCWFSRASWNSCRCELTFGLLQWIGDTFCFILIEHVGEMIVISFCPCITIAEETFYVVPIGELFYYHFVSVFTEETLCVVPCWVLSVGLIVDGCFVANAGNFNQFYDDWFVL